MVPLSGPPGVACGRGTPLDMGGIAIVQEFLPSSPSKKVRTSFKTADKTKKQHGVLWPFSF